MSAYVWCVCVMYLLWVVDELLLEVVLDGDQLDLNVGAFEEFAIQDTDLVDEASEERKWKAIDLKGLDLQTGRGVESMYE